MKKLKQLIKEGLVLETKNARLMPKDIHPYWISTYTGFAIASSIADQSMEILGLSAEDAKALAVSKFFRHSISDDVMASAAKIIKKELFNLKGNKNSLKHYLS